MVNYGYRYRVLICNFAEFGTASSCIIWLETELQSKLCFNQSCIPVSNYLYLLNLHSYLFVDPDRNPDPDSEVGKKENDDQLFTFLEQILTL
jgi:hypothetical protein